MAIIDTHLHQKRVLEGMNLGENLLAELFLTISR